MNPGWVVFVVIPLIWLFVFGVWLYLDVKKSKKSNGWNGVIRDMMMNETSDDKVGLLLKKLGDLRVLRSSCESSNEGQFRVHLDEKEWDEIVEILKGINP